MKAKVLFAASVLHIAAAAGTTSGHTYGGHSYEVTHAGNWSQAEAEAVSAGGHLECV